MLSLHGAPGTDPELWLAIVRRCEKLAPTAAASVLDALHELDPEAVLETYFEVLVS